MFLNKSVNHIYFHIVYLTLHKHGHVHEHVVELLDGGLQLDDVCVPRLDVRQGLLGCSCVHDNALKVKLVFQSCQRVRDLFLLICTAKYQVLLKWLAF